MDTIRQLFPGWDSFEESDQHRPASGGAWRRSESGRCVGISLNSLGEGVSELRAAMERGLSVLVMGESAGCPAGTVRHNPIPTPHPRSVWDLALGTSGSTGEARIVATTCDRVVQGIRAIHSSQGLERIESTGIVLPLHYSFAFVNQLLWSFWSGRRCVFTGGLRNPVQTLEALRDSGVEMTCLVAEQVRALVGVGIDPERFALPDMRVVNFAGSPFPFDVLPFLGRLFPNARFTNNYGCTEAFPRISSRSVRVDAPGEFQDVGLPIGSVDVSIRDDQGDLVPTGEVGWIHVGGASTATGLVDGDGNLAPFPEHGPRSGDLGYLGVDGRLHLVGRADGIVKIAGERISVANVEGVLRELEGVLDATVAPCSGGAFGMELRAALVCVGPPDRKRLIEHLRDRLPNHARPRRILLLEGLPRLPSGKTDLARLREFLEMGEGTDLLKPA